MSLSSSPRVQPLDDPPSYGSPRERAGVLPAWAQALVIVALFFGIKAIPGIPYGGPIGLIACLFAATWMLRSNGQSWADLGLRRARSGKGVALGAAMVVLVFVAAAATNGVVQPLLNWLLGDAAAREFPDVSTLPLYVIMMVIVWTTASFGEEMVFRGFLMSRFSAMFGGTTFAWIIAAFLQAALFGVGHAYQGIGGIIVTGSVGLAFGLLYLLARRNLWPLIIGHGLINTYGITVLHLIAIGALPDVQL